MAFPTNTRIKSATQREKKPLKGALLSNNTKKVAQLLRFFYSQNKELSKSFLGPQSTF